MMGRPALIDGEWGQNMDLKDCICGGNPRINEIGKVIVWFFVSCPNCGNFTQPYEFVTDAQTIWNSKQWKSVMGRIEA